MHKPIRFKDLSLSFPHKTCFSEFSEEVLHGSRIAIIGPNGIGKSTLLKIIKGTWTRYEGSLSLPPDLNIGYLPQLIITSAPLSGGERLNQALTKALCHTPNLLLLDEPTNHLDKTNRRALINHLRHYRGTLIIVTHDEELLRNNVDTIWHIQGGKINVFKGDYDDYQSLLDQKSASIEEEMAALQSQKREAQRAKMKEQVRNKKMRLRGEKSIKQRKWPTVRSSSKLGSAVKTGNQRLRQIQERKEELTSEMAGLYRPEIIKPQFQLPASVHQKSVITIKEASVSYHKEAIILGDIDFHMRSKERVALCGANGSGKSTFVKAILEKDHLIKTGSWDLPKTTNIGYLDQHYENLQANKTLLEMMESLMPNATNHERRSQLNAFLFRKNEEVEANIADLSGGEKARFSLCCIAARPPNLLILDEMTNNLDLETREHIIQILRGYPGALLVISHDHAFLKAIGIETVYFVQEGKIEWRPSLEAIK
jgi:ATPase subunit of ABC transporter with duplicated ATPase domains